jgi:hypothetical protein
MLRINGRVDETVDDDRGAESACSHTRDCVISRGKPARYGPIMSCPVARRCYSVKFKFGCQRARVVPCIAGLRGCLQGPDVQACSKLCQAFTSAQHISFIVYPAI